MSQVGANEVRGFDLENKIDNSLLIFNLLRFIGIDILQTTISVSTLYLFPFSSYMKKTKQ